MTDVKGAGHISANSRIEFEKKHTEKESDVKKVGERTEEPGKLLDSLDAMSAYNHPKINRSQNVKGEYKFDPKNVERDVIVFKENFDAVNETSKAFLEDLLKEGYPYEKAINMTAEFAANLLMLDKLNEADK